MATDEQKNQFPWEVPAATALTDTESRADQADIWLQNATGVGGSTPG